MQFRKWEVFKQKMLNKPYIMAFSILDANALTLVTLTCLGLNVQGQSITFKSPSFHIDYILFRFLSATAAYITLPPSFPTLTLVTLTCLGLIVHSKSITFKSPSSHCPHNNPQREREREREKSNTYGRIKYYLNLYNLATVPFYM